MFSSSGIQPLTLLSTPRQVALIGVLVAVAYVLAGYSKLRVLVKQYGGIPGRFNLFGNSEIVVIFPDVPGLNRGYARDWNNKHDSQEELNSEVITEHSILPRPSVALNITDAAIIKEITTNRAAFPKPYEFYEKVEIFGPNILTTEGAIWKAHRKISAPAFSERNNALVHEETKRLLLELFGTWESTGQIDAGCTIELDDVRPITLALALQVIATAGFGYKVGWNDDQPPPPGHTMTFKAALRDTISDLPWRMVLPRNILQMFSRGRRVVNSFDEVEKYMKEMVQSRIESPDVERADLLTNLCAASMDTAAEKGEETIIPNEAELIGNIYIFLLAGHETTARALSYVIAILALHQDIQQKVLEEVLSIVGPGKLPTYAHINKLKYTEAVLYETMRQYPLVSAIPKRSEHDTVITATKADETQQVIPIPARTHINLSVAGLHYNPRDWPDPYTFDPERFMKPYNKDAFIPFSAGARACLGRRFAEVEAITAIAMIVSLYHVSFKEGADVVGTDSKGRSFIKTIVGVFTLTSAKLPLVLRKRLI